MEYGSYIKSSPVRVFQISLSQCFYLLIFSSEARLLPAREVTQEPGTILERPNNTINLANTRGFDHHTHGIEDDIYDQNTAGGLEKA